MKNKLYKDVKSFIIKRSKWLRSSPQKIESGVLLDKTQKMCCLGFYAKACGFKNKDISNLCEPCQIEIKESNFESFLISKYGGSSYDCNRLININDSTYSYDDQKEKSIKKIFAKHKIKVKFID